MAFDYDEYWEALERNRRPVLTPALPRQPVLRNWSWPLTKAYNGYSPVERVRGWQFSWYVIMAGLMKIGACEVCGSKQGVGLHSEDYYNIYTAPALCKSCHSAVHLRFRKPHMWRDFVYRHQFSTPGMVPWYALLPTHEIDLAGYVRGRFGDGVRDLLNSPLYTIPAFMPAPLGTFLGDEGPPERRPPPRHRQRAGSAELQRVAE